MSNALTIIDNKNHINNDMINFVIEEVEYVRVCGISL